MADHQFVPQFRRRDARERRRFIRAAAEAATVHGAPRRVTPPANERAPRWRATHEVRRCAAARALYRAPLGERKSVRHISRGARDHGVADDGGDRARQPNAAVERRRSTVCPSDHELGRIDVCAVQVGEFGRGRDPGALERRRRTPKRRRQIAGCVEQRYGVERAAPSANTLARALDINGSVSALSYGVVRVHQWPKLLGEPAVRGTWAARRKGVRQFGRGCAMRGRTNLSCVTAVEAGVSPRGSWRTAWRLRRA